MSMRISDAIILFCVALPLAACGEQKSNSLAVAAEPIECAIGEGAVLARDCTVERSEGEQGMVLTVRQPDGGFHRLRMVDDGQGVIVADGAEPAQLRAASDGIIDVTIGAARYRLPATIGAPAQP